MKLDKTQIDALFKEINEFERTIPGLKYGQDYPEFALAMVGSEALESLIHISVLSSMMDLFCLKDKVRDPKTLDTMPDSVKQSLLNDFVKQSSHREDLLRAAYLGYRLGKLSKEG